MPIGENGKTLRIPRFWRPDPTNTMPNGINIVEILCVRLEYHVNGSRLSREVSVMAIEKRSPKRQVVDGRTIEIPCPTIYLRWLDLFQKSPLSSQSDLLTHGLAAIGRLITLEPDLGASDITTSFPVSSITASLRNKGHHRNFCVHYTRIHAHGT